MLPVSLSQSLIKTQRKSTCFTNTRIITTEKIYIRTLICLSIAENCLQKAYNEWK